MVLRKNGDGALFLYKKRAPSPFFPIYFISSAGIALPASDTKVYSNEEDAAYRFAKAGSVSNWFDEADFKTDCLLRVSLYLSPFC